jgi:hypothetical protein
MRASQHKGVTAASVAKRSSRFPCDESDSHIVTPINLTGIGNPALFNVRGFVKEQASNEFNQDEAR